MKGSPPERMISRIVVSLFKYLRDSSKNSPGSHALPTILFLLQNLQYMAHSELIKKTALPGYLFIRTGVTEISRSLSGSSSPSSFNSSTDGIACCRIGQKGLLISISLR